MILITSPVGFCDVSGKHQGKGRQSAGKLVSVEETFAILETPDEQTAVPIDSVTQMHINALPLRIHLVQRDGKPVNGKVNLGMAYLRQGIIWLPDYSFELTDENHGKLNLRGTLINAAEDLIHTDVSFVVGVPHFAHRDYLAPLAVGQVIRSVGSAVAPASVGSQILNRAAIVSNNNGMNDFELQAGLQDSGEARLGAMVGSVPDMPASVSSADYTYHTVPDLTLRRGEKAIVNLYKGMVRYDHLYRWEIPSDVQHLLVMFNESDTAWTTGPCLAVRGRHPLSEDLLTYTPKGGRSELPIGTAINISHRETEKEVDRKGRAYENIVEYATNGHPKRSEFWDLVTLEGTIKIKNYEDHPAKLIVTQPVSGSPLTASHDGQTRLDTTKLQLITRSGSVRWEVAVQPGAETTLKYKYERYVKSP